LIAATFGTAGYPVPYIVQEHRAAPPSKLADLKTDLAALGLPATAAGMPVGR